MITVTLTEYIRKFEDLITEYSDAFAMSDDELREGARIKPIELRLKDRDSKPVRGFIYNHSAPERAEIKKQMDKMLENGFMVRGASPYACGLLMVRKKSGEKRIVWDLRKLNSVMEDRVYAPPTIPEIVRRIGAQKACYFTTIEDSVKIP